MDQSVASLFELYLARSDLRPASIRFKRRAQKYFQMFFGDPVVQDVTRETAEDYRTLLAKGRSKSSANGYLSNYKPFWQWLLGHGLIAKNPFYGVRLFRNTIIRAETFSATELSRLMFFSSVFWRVRIAFGLLGCRRGEMLNICTRDINLSSQHPHVYICPKVQTSDTWPWQVKNYKPGYIALPERLHFTKDVIVELHKDIRSRMEHLQANQPYINLEAKHFERMLQRQREGTLTDEHIADPCGNFQRSFRQLQRRMGINPPRRFHELRAAFITIMDKACGISTASDAARHSNIQTTMGYRRFSEMSLIDQIASVTENAYRSLVP